MRGMLTLPENSLTGQAVAKFKGTREKNRELSRASHTKTKEKKQAGSMPKPGMFHLEEHTDWLFPNPRGEEFRPNARFRFTRAQVVECYDKAGEQTLMLIEEDWKTDGVFKEDVVKIKTARGVMAFPRSEVFFIAWLSEIPAHLR